MKTQKHLFMSLLVLLSLAFTPGCGSKDNEAGDSNPVNQPPPVVDPIIIDGREDCRTDIYDLDSLKTAVSNAEFVSQNYPIVMYVVSKGKRRGIFYTYSNSSTRVSYETGNVTHEYGSTREAIRDGLSSRLSDGVNYYKMGAGYHRIETSNGDVYDIDLCSPIAANPINFYDKSANEYYRVTNWFFRYY